LTAEDESFEAAVRWSVGQEGSAVEKLDASDGDDVEIASRLGEVDSFERVLIGFVEGIKVISKLHESRVLSLCSQISK